MQLDKTLNYVISAAIQQLSPKRILLYGSRARGDAREQSDYDIAMDCPTINEPTWSKFVLNLADCAPTLHHMDVVCLQKISKSLYDEIVKTGVILYKKRTKRGKTSDKKNKQS